MNKTVMITGSTGFVGTNFIRKSNDLIIKEVDLISTKIDDIDFSDCDCVFHLSALVHQMNGAPKENYFSVNSDLAYELAKKAKLKGVRLFVFMSTAKVYGESNTGRESWKEDTECQPADPYSESKLQAEKLIQSIEDNHFKVAVIRSPMIYGPGVKGNMFRLIDLLYKYPVLPLGGIQNKRSMVYADNLTAMVKQIINKTESGIFIPGDQRSISTSTLCRLIAKNLNKRILLIKTPGILVSLLKHFIPHFTERIWGSLELNNSKSNEKLGFIPPYSTEIGIQAMVEWYLKDKHCNYK
jgi:nucleoside-diphosphate-sugar epimerase